MAGYSIRSLLTVAVIVTAVLAAGHFALSAFDTSTDSALASVKSWAPAIFAGLVLSFVLANFMWLAPKAQSEAEEPLIRGAGDYEGDHAAVVHSLRNRANAVRVSGRWILGSLAAVTIGGVGALWWTSVPPEVAEKFDAGLFIAYTLPTRLAIVAIVLFLVNVLVSMHRYNARLAAYYDGRADALQVGAESVEELGNLVGLLAGDSLAFGPVPASALDTIIKSVSEAAIEVAKKSSK